MNSDAARQAGRRTVLFTGAGGAASESVHRQWQGRYDLRFADADLQAVPPSIPEDLRVAIPRADAPDFVDALVDACERLGVDVLVPGVDEELRHVAELTSRLPGVDVLAPPQEFVDVMLDKLGSVELLRSHGLDAPSTVTADRASEVAYPCVAKPRSGRGSRGVMVLRSPAQVEPYLALHELPAHRVVLQELLVGEEYTTYVSADAAGELRCVIPVLVEQKRGVTIRARIDIHPDVVGYCEALHAALRPSGVYNVQLIRTPDGRVAPFEVNPRVSTTFSLAIAAGADPVAAFRPGDVGGAGGRQDAVPALRLQRYWLNHISEEVPT